MTYAATAAWLRERLWVGAVVGVVPWAVWIGSLAVGGWYKDADGQLLGPDHLAFYSAAHLIREGQQTRLYDYLDLAHENYQQNLVGWPWGGFMGYRNPPFYALLYLPTAGFSFYTSFLIWTAIGFMLLALAIGLLKPEHPQRTFLWALAFYPVFATASFGQNTLISLTIFAGVYRLLASERRLGAGLIAGLLWFKPQLLLGLFIWWAFFPQRYLRCWFGVALMGLVLAALSWLALPGGSEAFVRTFWTNLSYHGEGFWNKHSPRAFFAMLLTHPTNDRSSIVLIPAAICSLVSIALAWRVARRTDGPVATMFPVAVFLSLWATPHALIYEWALLVAAGVVLWERFPARRDVWLCLFALVMVALAVSTPLALVQIKTLPMALQISVPVLGVAGYLAIRELMTAQPEAPCRTETPTPTPLDDRDPSQPVGVKP